MDVGRFYFVKDEFFDKFDTEHRLMQNKEKVDGKSANRPCFMAFPDTQNNQIFWLVPISSKVEKYEGIVKQKAQKRAKMNKPPIKCDTIVFGEVVGQKCAFLIQNMFPITENYILNQFFEKHSNNEVRIPQNLEQDIISSAKRVLSLNRTRLNLIFSDIDTIYQKLQAELLQKTVDLSTAKSVTSTISTSSDTQAADKEIISESEQHNPKHPKKRISLDDRLMQVRETRESQAQQEQPRSKSNSRDDR